MEVAREPLWRLFTDIPESATCLPGVESIERVGRNLYHGTLIVRLGPFALRLHGRIIEEEKNRDAWRLAWRAEAEDRRIASAMHGTATMELGARNAGVTEATLEIDISILGRIGELGRPIVRRKVNQLLTRFFRNVGRKLAGDNAAQTRPWY